LPRTTPAALEIIGFVIRLAGPDPAFVVFLANDSDHLPGRRDSNRLLF
jgi:hypothetical protein